MDPHHRCLHTPDLPCVCVFYAKERSCVVLDTWASRHICIICMFPPLLPSLLDPGPTSMYASWGRLGVYITILLFLHIFLLSPLSGLSEKGCFSPVQMTLMLCMTMIPLTTMFFHGLFSATLPL
ncbi:hypothetical protein CC80DRAFT_11645 [Byssothecium circinans]|uniref:Uncharacterized protein n=1 Tax=Byssothecium circinans TaxID=147558 RepID=A0A6A5UL91_9PLEO|nr:hypothetical protein CC80DRAFT_11645 [Byssothecium circinans]